MWVVGDAYWTYAVCIFAITWFSIITSAAEAHSNMKRLADIAYFATEVQGGGAWVGCMGGCMGLLRGWAWRQRAAGWPFPYLTPLSPQTRHLQPP